MKFYPASGVIAVKVIEESRTTASGIVLSDNALVDRVSRAEVIAVSRVRIETTPDYADSMYSLGDTVLFMKGSGVPVKIEGVDLVLLKETELLGSIG